MSEVTHAEPMTQQRFEHKSSDWIITKEGNIYEMLSGFLSAFHDNFSHWILRATLGRRCSLHFADEKVEADEGKSSVLTEVAFHGVFFSLWVAATSEGLLREFTPEMDIATLWSEMLQ